MGNDWERGEAAYWEEAAQRNREYGAAIPREHYRMMPEISIKRGGVQFNAASPSVSGAPTIIQSLDMVRTFETNYPAFTEYAKGVQMQNDQDLLTQAEELRDQAAKLERIVAEREKYGDDPFKNGTILKVEMRYRTGSRRSFTYGVVKVGGKFYLSGKLGQPTSVAQGLGWTWEQFVAWLSQGDATVWQAKSLVQVF